MHVTQLSTFVILNFPDVGQPLIDSFLDDFKVHEIKLDTDSPNGSRKTYMETQTCTDCVCCPLSTSLNYLFVV